MQCMREALRRDARSRRRSKIVVANIRSLDRVLNLGARSLMTGRLCGGGNLGRGLSNALVHLVRKLREVLDEQVDQLGRRTVVLGLVVPGAPRIENVRDSRQLDRDVEA